MKTVPEAPLGWKPIHAPENPKGGALTASKAPSLYVLLHPGKDRGAYVMRVKTTITAALALSVVGGGCSRPWQASTADLAPLNSRPYGQTRNSNSFDPPSQYPDGERASPSNPLGPESEPQPPPAWPGARKVKTITIPGPDAHQ